MKILIVGDSITQGYHDFEVGGWCQRLVNFAMQKEVESDFEYNRSVFNLGIAGDTSEGVLSRVESEVKARVNISPEENNVAILAIGVNDSQFEISTGENKIPVGETTKNLSEISDKLSKLVSQVVVVGIAPVHDERVNPMEWKPTHAYSNEVIAQYNQVLKKFTEEKSLAYIDMSNVYQGDEEGCLPDGIHPNAKGHQLIFERVKTSLEKVNIL